MKTNHFQQMITETLESCLSKMSNKLNTSFDPNDKSSIKLLQQFRSTLNSWRSWLKQTAPTNNETSKTIKNGEKNSINLTQKDLPPQKSNDFSQIKFPNYIKNPLNPPNQKPSGLLKI